MKNIETKALTVKDIEDLTDVRIEIYKYIIFVMIIILTVFTVYINLNPTDDMETFEDIVKSNGYELVQATFYPEYIDINGKEFTHINDKGLSNYYEKQSYFHESSNEPEIHNVYYNKSDDYSIYTEKGLKSIYNEAVDSYILLNRLFLIAIVIIGIFLLYIVNKIVEEWAIWPNSIVYKYVFRKMKEKHSIQF